MSQAHGGKWTLFNVILDLRYIQVMNETKGQHGGQRPGAGRPRTETLDAGELRLLLKLLSESAFSAEYADTARKLGRMLERLEGGR